MLDSKAHGPAREAVDAHIGGRVAARRETLGLSLGDVAEILGIDGAVLGDLERGHKPLAARQLWTLSRRLQVPMAWFFKMADDEPQPAADGARRKGAEVLFVPNPDLDWPSGIGRAPVH